MSIKKYGPRVHPSKVVNTKKHWAVGTVWNVVGKDYKIEMKDNGFTCSCPAFKYCKHIKEVENGFCDE